MIISCSSMRKRSRLVLDKEEAKAFASFASSCPWNSLGTRQKGSCEDHQLQQQGDPSTPYPDGSGGGIG